MGAILPSSTRQSKTVKPQTYIDFILPNMEGWCSREKAVDLVNTVWKAKPKTAVEIGVFAGRSLLAIALTLPEGSTVIGIDPWAADASIRGFDDENKTWWAQVDHDRIYTECTLAIKLLGIKNIRLFRLTAEQALAQGHIPDVIDFLHIDGNHSEESSCFDVANYVPRVPSGKAVWLDDLEWPCTQKAQAILFETCKLERTIVSGTAVCGVFIKR